MEEFPKASDVQEQIDELVAERDGLLEAQKKANSKKRKAITGAFTDRLAYLNKVLKASEALEEGTPQVIE